MIDTDALIDRLSAGSALPAKGHARQFAMPLLAAVVLCGVGMMLVLEGPFSSVGEHGMGPIVTKWAFSISLVLLSAIALWIMGKPGRHSRWALAAVAVPFAPIAALLVFEVAIAGPQMEAATWRQCLAAMLIMSPLAFAGAIIAMRALAPTDLRRAGLVAGLFGGAVAMTVYAPFCPELGMLYMAVFYCLPMLAMAGLGWLTGPRLLRW